MTRQRSQTSMGIIASAQDAPANTPNGLVLNGSGSCCADSPDNAKYAASGVLRFVIRAKGTDWTGAGNQILLGQWDSGAENGFLVYIDTSGELNWAKNGSQFGTATGTSLTNGTAYWLGIEVNTGTGGNAYYKAADNAAMPSLWAGWTAIGTDSPGTGAISNVATTITIGSTTVGNGGEFTGTIYRAVYYDDGVVLLDADYTASGSPLAVPGASSYTDSASNVWTNRGAEVITS